MLIWKVKYINMIPYDDLWITDINDVPKKDP